MTKMPPDFIAYFKSQIEGPPMTIARLLKVILLSLAITMLASVTFSRPAHADTLKEGYPICIGEELLDQMYAAILNQDLDGIEYLLGRGCSLTKAGVKASILGQSGWSRAHIRVYAEKDVAEAWVSRGALESWKP